MGDPLKKVQRGDPLKIPAETFNTFIDTALDYKRRQLARNLPDEPRFQQTGVFKVRNSSGADRDQSFTNNYRKLFGEVTAVTLDEAVDRLAVKTVDYLKCDCEGSEHSLLGCAAEETLKRIRFLAGEYHGLERFYPVVEKLRTTHYVSLIGNRRLGAFFAERITGGPTLLRKEPLSPRVYPHLSDRRLTWHPFDRQHIPQAEWLIHGIT